MEKENKKKPFRLTITDNETGEVIRDLELDAIIGAVHLDEETSGGLFISRCSTLALAETVRAAEITTEKALKNSPMLRLAKSLVEAGEVEEIEDTENEEPENEE